MTCADAHHLILTADLSALRGESDATMRAHLAGCANCAAAASHIVGDTARLRSALGARGRRPEVRQPNRRRVAVSLIPVALAAEIALIVFFSNRQSVPGIERRAIDDSTMTLLPVAVGRDSEVTALSGRGKAAAVAPTRNVERRPGVNPGVTGDSQATVRVGQPSASGPSEREESMSQVQVSPVRQRAAIFATSNPKITVVWLTKGDSL